MALRSVLKFPVDLLIFSALSSRWPLQRTERGHLERSAAQMAVWLYSANVRWFWMRSLPAGAV
jgi:hypothetical protein